MEMMYRISQLKPEIIELAENLKFEVKEEKATVKFSKENFVATLDWRETTGPVTETFLEKWVKNFPEVNRLLLIVMGYFTAKALKHVLNNRTLRNKISLIEFGLRDYVDEEFKPKILSMSKNELIDEIISLIKNSGLKISSFNCNFCGNQVTVCCSTCNSLLCKSHMIVCPVCNEHFCHPDLTRKNCFFDHKCK